MEVKDLLQRLGIDEAETLEDFSEKFNSKFVSKDSAWQDDEVKSKITGKVAGSINSFAKREFGLDPSEIKDKKWEDVLKMGVEKLKAEKLELEEMSGKGSDEKFNELSEKLKKAEKTISDYKVNLDNTSKLIEQKDIEYNNSIKSLKVENILKENKVKIMPKLKSNMTEAERFYFDHKIKETIDLDFDENGDAVVLDKKGSRLPNPNKIGSFLSLDEVLEDIASKNNLLIKNNVAQTNVKANIEVPTNNTSKSNDGGRQIHPSILAKRKGI